MLRGCSKQLPTSTGPAKLGAAPIPSTSHHDIVESDFRCQLRVMQRRAVGQNKFMSLCTSQHSCCEDRRADHSCLMTQLDVCYSSCVPEPARAGCPRLMQHIVADKHSSRFACRCPAPSSLHWLWSGFDLLLWPVDRVIVPI